MCGDSLSAATSMMPDYVVFAFMLAVSAAIGLYYSRIGRGKGNTRDFLTGGRKLTALPVALSLSATFMSSVTILSQPAEVYRYGAIIGYVCIDYFLATVFTSEVFLPLFYRLAITSIYEYLELRFNKVIRLLGTCACILRAVLFSGLVIYAPALALSQVTGWNLWFLIIATGVICTIYCALGGLKAVVWTDVFQTGIMLAGFLSAIIRCVILKGGISTILSDSQGGGRINFLDFDLNPLRRHTFWTIVIGGTVSWTMASGIAPSQVQRYNSCKNITHARLALLINLVSLCLFLASSVFAGLCLYSFYKNCDPWTAGLVSSSDQLMPYLVMDVLQGYPGLPGLFFAAVFSGTLSTVSSTINSLAAVTIEDLIKPYTNLSDKQLLRISKGLSFCFGFVCISMAGLASFMGLMVQAVTIISGVIGGPMFGLFILGILCPFANSKGALFGLTCGFAATLLVSLGHMLSYPDPEMARPLSLSTEGCNSSTVGVLNWTTALPTEPSSVTIAQVQPSGIHLMPNWRSPSYLYFSVIGVLTSVVMGMIVSLCTGGLNQKVEPRLMLMKEDTMSYGLFKLVKCRVTKQTRRAKRSETEEEIEDNLRMNILHRRTASATPKGED